jgi:hypothetical protein
VRSTRGDVAAARDINPYSLGADSQEFTKLIGSQSGIAYDSAHRESVDGVVTRDRDDSGVVGHDDVFALPCDSEPGLLERANGVEMIDSGNTGHD